MVTRANHIEIQKLKRALRLCAKIVVLHGEAYYPLFERLEKELKYAEEKQKIKERALAILYS